MPSADLNAYIYRSLGESAKPVEELLKDVNTQLEDEGFKPVSKTAIIYHLKRMPDVMKLPFKKTIHWKTAYCLANDFGEIPDAVRSYRDLTNRMFKLARDQSFTSSDRVSRYLNEFCLSVCREAKEGPPRIEGLCEKCGGRGRLYNIIGEELEIYFPPEEIPRLTLEYLGYEYRREMVLAACRALLSLIEEGGEAEYIRLRYNLRKRFSALKHHGPWAQSFEPWIVDMSLNFLVRLRDEGEIARALKLAYEVPKWHQISDSSISPASSTRFNEAQRRFEKEGRTIFNRAWQARKIRF